MLHEHIKAYADWFDEINFQIRFRKQFAHNANKEFCESDDIDPRWMKNIWQSLFEAKAGAAAIEICPGLNVLAICCGQGFLGEFCEDRGANVTFTDLSMNQLSSLTKRLSASDKRPSVVQSDLLDLPFPENTFDIVLENSFLHHLPDVPAALREIHRILSPGGDFVLFHEPSINSNFFESFPVSLFRDTSRMNGFTDLWTFAADDIRKLQRDCGFQKTRMFGTGILSSILCNPCLILMSRMGFRPLGLLLPLLKFRVLLNKMEFLSGELNLARSPSFFAVAIRSF